MYGRTLCCFKFRYYPNCCYYRVLAKLSLEILTIVLNNGNNPSLGLGRFSLFCACLLGSVWLVTSHPHHDEISRSSRSTSFPGPLVTWCNLRWLHRANVASFRSHSCWQQRPLRWQGIIPHLGRSRKPHKSPAGESNQMFKFWRARSVKLAERAKLNLFKGSWFRVRGC